MDTQTASTAAHLPPPHFDDTATAAARRQVALTYAHEVLDASAADGPAVDYRHALMVVTDELRRADDQVARMLAGHAPVVRARRVLDACRRPDRCSGSARFVTATGLGLTTCRTCGQRVHVEPIRGCLRWEVVADHRPAPSSPTLAELTARVRADGYVAVAKPPPSLPADVVARQVAAYPVVAMTSMGVRELGPDELDALAASIPPPWTVTVRAAAHRLGRRALRLIRQVSRP